MHAPDLTNGFIESWWAHQIQPQRNGEDGADWRELLPEHLLLTATTVSSPDLDRVGGAAALGGQLGCSAPAPAGQH